MNKEDSGDCCKDTQKFIKSQDHQKVTETFVTTIFPEFSDTSLSFITKEISALVTVNYTFPFSNAPPGLIGNCLYLRNRVFLI